MSRNQQSNCHPKGTVPVKFAHLELVSDKSLDLEFSTAEVLRRTQEQLLWYRKLYEHAPAIYLSLNTEGQILSINEYGRVILGYTPEDLIKKPVFNLFKESDHQRLVDGLTNLQENSRENTDWEFPLENSSGKTIWVRITARLLPHQEQTVILMICEDITSYKANEDALPEAEVAQTQLEEIENLNRLKNEFLSTVSHELRTPLSNMKMAIQMLGIALNREQNFFAQMAKPEAERSKVARYFQILDKECDREINLINNFLDLQRLDVGTKPLVLETITVKEWLLQVVEVFKTRNHGNFYQNINLKVADNLPYVVSDPFGLERIVIELLTNGCKFSPTDEEIFVNAQLNLNHIQIQVINTGIEIPQTELPRIFDKFYRIPSNDPWKQGGTGLGLALVKKITNSLGGTIKVESGSNRTCFTIELPIQG